MSWIARLFQRHPPPTTAPVDAMPAAAELPATIESARRVRERAEREVFDVAPRRPGTGNLVADLARGAYRPTTRERNSGDD
jgi:hypothetical protein